MTKEQRQKKLSVFHAKKKEHQEEVKKTFPIIRTYFDKDKNKEVVVYAPSRSVYAGDFSHG